MLTLRKATATGATCGHRHGLWKGLERHGCRTDLDLGLSSALTHSQPGGESARPFLSAPQFPYL